MKVFISWSGEVSHAVALALKNWLPNVIQALEPFVSSEDIAKGGRWLSRINAELEGAGFGIICLTPQNLQSPWVLFEAGAIAVRFPEGRVAPLLIGLERAQVTPPISQFQFTEPVRIDMLRLVSGINASLAEKHLPAERLSKAFEHYWPDLEAVLIEQSKRAAAPPATGLKLPPKRDIESMVAEVLDLVRSMQRRAGANEEPSLVQRMREQEILAAHLRGLVGDREGALGNTTSALQRIIADRGIRSALGDTVRDALGETVQGALKDDDKP